MAFLVFKCYFSSNHWTCVLFDSEKDFFIVEAIERRKKPLIQSPVDDITPGYM